MTNRSLPLDGSTISKERSCPSVSLIDVKFDKKIITILQEWSDVKQVFPSRAPDDHHGIWEKLQPFIKKLQ